MSENENKNNDSFVFEEIEDKYVINENNVEDQRSAFAVSYTDDTPPPPKGYSIASMVLGILSVLCCCGSYPFFFLFFIPLTLGILAIIFRRVAKKKGANDGMMTAGLICGIIGIIIAMVGVLITVLVIAGLIELANEVSTTLII